MNVAFWPSPPRMTAVPLVSVVVPAYNRAEVIGPALESVLRQTWRDLELIVVDDGSTDDTLAAVRRIDDPRIRLIASAKNMGAGGARNLGIEEARGVWVAFQDSDDEWLPLKLERQMARLLAPGSDYVAAYCGMLILDKPHGQPSGGWRLRPRYFPGPDAALFENDRLEAYLRRRFPSRGTSRPAVLEGDLVEPLLRRSLVSTQTLVARRDRLREIGGFDPELLMMIDRDCVLRLAPLGPIAFVDEPLVLQRFSANSISGDSRRLLPSQIRMAEKFAPLLARHPDAGAWLQYAIAGGHRRAGNLGSACAAIDRACRLQPGNLRYRAMSVTLWLRALFGSSRG